MTLATVRFSRHDGVTVGRISGDIDISNAGDVAGRLAGTHTTPPGMALDLAAVTYLDSRGVHLIFELAQHLRTRQQRLVVVAPPDSPIRRVLEVSHVETAVRLHPTVQEAVRDLKAG